MTSKLAERKTRQAHYKTRLARLKQTGETQHAEVDPDARLLTKSAQSVAGYNVQIATDAQHKLMVHCDVTADGNDTQQLSPVAQEVKAILDVDILESGNVWVTASRRMCRCQNIMAPKRASVCRALPSRSKKTPTAIAVGKGNTCNSAAPSRKAGARRSTMSARQQRAPPARCASVACLRKRGTGKSIDGSMKRCSIRIDNA